MYWVGYVEDRVAQRSKYNVGNGMIGDVFEAVRGSECLEFSVSLRELGLLGQETFGDRPKGGQDLAFSSVSCEQSEVTFLQ